MKRLPTPRTILRSASAASLVLLVALLVHVLRQPERFHSSGWSDTRSAGTAAIPSRRLCRGGAALHGSVLAGGVLLPGR